MQSPPPCPLTVTIRRNPHRKARATPSSAIPFPLPTHPLPSLPSLEHAVSPQKPKTTGPTYNDPSSKTIPENLKVYLRIRPINIQKDSKKMAESKNFWPKNPKLKVDARQKTTRNCEPCVQVNDDLRSVTVLAPQELKEFKRIKSEVYEGFSHVFSSEASQTDLYDKMMNPLVEEFHRGKSGLLAAMGPSGSGKTHTILGSAREPGMVPLALRHIFSDVESNGTQSMRMYHLSMFEICSEKGKAERLVDLLQENSALYMQHSTVKGLQEVVVSDALQAESIIAQGMLKRSTAMTKSNSQSSRSQCIINIRYDSRKDDVNIKPRSIVLTIVDLAGAEREKKTGNQGARLLESNFINNTSMVFGLCLRALLECQKNRTKPLEKHYQNSLLTRFLRDHLEGKKRMMLVLTVKPGIEDYLDTSFLLRQASPFANIKFKNLVDTVNLNCNKRPDQSFPRAEKLKKMKFNANGVSLVNEVTVDTDLRSSTLEISRKVVSDGLNQNAEDIDSYSTETNILSDELFSSKRIGNPSCAGKCIQNNINENRKYQIMQGIAKALWNVLKQCKEKLKGVENENSLLRENLSIEKSRCLYLESQLAEEKSRSSDFEKDAIRVESQQFMCPRQNSVDVHPTPLCYGSSDSQVDLASSVELVKHADCPQHEVILHNTNDEDLSATTSELECGFINTTAIKVSLASGYIGREMENSKPERESSHNGPCHDSTLEGESSRTSPAHCSVREVPGDQVQLENGANGNSVSSLVEDLTPSVLIHSQAVSLPESISSFSSEEQFKNDEDKLKPSSTKQVKEGWDGGKNMLEVVPKLASCGNFQNVEKPKRRLLPASSVLLKDIGRLEVNDDCEKPKAARGAKAEHLDKRNRTPGSVHLLHLLTTKFGR